MLEWLGRQSWGLEEALAVAGIIATIAVAGSAPLRRWLGQLVKVGLMRAGRPEHRYAKWFVNKWGVYDNPYLAEPEDLDLGSTYVSLSFRVPNAPRETRTDATKVLANRKSGNLIIEGEPGSGKSTLLKAYGVGALKRQRRTPRLPHQQDIPFFVQLRKFAQQLDRSDGSLAKYVIDDILVSGAGMSRPDATDFLLHALTSGRALIMLDGLDEVAHDRQAAVKEAVYRFTQDRDPTRPTHRARLIVTCRRQNFVSLHEEWVPAIAGTVCMLEPFSDSEIKSYLDKLRSKFKVTGGPESFFRVVRASGTLDLHRVPLILAMSVGLYVRKDYFEIPRSIARLYRTMIEEMLDRQRFKRDPGGGVLAFQVGDKHRFLREFALFSAAGSKGFNEFDRNDLVKFVRPLAPNLDAVTDPDAFVQEIVERSGLLSDVSEAGQFIFAHRSIHEYLVAEELLLLPDGGSTLLKRAADPEWRQVVLFYTAALEQRAADRFLSELASRNAVLAGLCLAGAKPSNDVATAILDSLGTADPVHVVALVAATISPRQAVREMAVSKIEAQLPGSMNEVSAAFGWDVDGMLSLLRSLAGSNAARIAALVPEFAANIPDDPRLVEPLWQCLAAPDIERQPACRTIVERLLTIATSADGFDELQRQEPYTRAFLTEPARRHAYPFEGGLPLNSNLVSLLAWADWLDVVPAQPNRFFQAKMASRLSSVERDKRRTLGFSLFWPARVISAAATLLSVGAAAAILILDWRALLHPFGGWSPIVSLALVAASVVGAVMFSAWAEARPEESWSYRRLAVSDEKDMAHILAINDSEVWKITAYYAGPVAYVVAITPVAALSIPGYVAVAIIGPAILFVTPIMKFVGNAARYYVYRPSRFIDMYDDPRSQHWLTPGSARAPIAEPVETS
jgi:NACHT domain